MTEQCLGRIIKRNDELIGHFPNGNRFYLEFRCGYKTEEGSICKRCLKWKEKGFNSKDIYGNHYGLVTDQLPNENCKIFDSPWYHSMVPKNGLPCEAEMVKAKQAQQEARKGIVAPAVTVLVQEVKEEPKKKGRKKKTAEPVPPPRPPSPEPQPPPPPPPPPPEPLPQPKPKAKSKRRTKTQEPIVPVQENVQVQAVESSTSTNELEIIKILVRPFSHNGTSYFRDTSKNKLYAVGKDKRPSSYVGRWNAENETIDTEFPDSDVEA